MSWDGTSFAPHQDPRSGLHFSVPNAGYRLVEEHFDASTPLYQVRHTFVLTGSAGPAVGIDVWMNPDGILLEKWFATNLGFMSASGSTIKRSANGILVEQPRSSQSHGRRAAIFRVGARVLRVTCHDVADVAAEKAFEAVVRSLGKGPRGGPTP